MGTGFHFSQVSADAKHACGVTGIWQAFCWGDDTFGQLGNGATTGSTDAPSPVSSPGK